MVYDSTVLSLVEEVIRPAFSSGERRLSQTDICWRTSSIKDMREV